MMSSMTESSVFHDIYNQPFYPADQSIRNLVNSTKDSKDYLQRLGLQSRLQVHAGCVNTICWNDTGEYLLSGSDDQFIAVTNPYNQETIFKYKTAHRANIFSARFMPQSNDKGIVSCSGDGVVVYTELTTVSSNGSPKHEANLNYFNCHNSGTAYEVMTVPTEPHSFMSCGEDGTVRLFDLRRITSCQKTCCKDNIFIFGPAAITALSVSPISHYYIAVGSSDSYIRIYDRRYLDTKDLSGVPKSSKGKQFTVPVKSFPMPIPAKRTYRVTSVKYSPDETELLVNYSSDYLYLFDLTKSGVDVNTALYKKDEKSILDASQATPVRKLRLRGDWSDTGPDARPERDLSGRVEVGQVRPQLHGNIMHRMTEVLSRMLSDPRTRIGLTGHSNEITQDNHALFVTAVREMENYPEGSQSENSDIRNEPVAGPSRVSNRQRSILVRDSDDDDDDEDDDMEGDNARHSGRDDTSSLNEELAKIEMETKEAIQDYMKMKFVGHRNARTMIKEATFWGSKYIMSGSDCGHVFVWDRQTGKLQMLLQADQHVVNCLQPHPTMPYLATSGIDYDVKLWAPILQENCFNEKEAEDLMERNAIMLEETKDTITVPAAFMIRMLSCIHSLRNRNRSANETTSNSNRRRNSNS